MVAFFIIPVSLNSTEIFIILIVSLLFFYRHKVAEFLCNVSRGLRNFRDELNDDK